MTPSGGGQDCVGLAVGGGGPSRDEAGSVIQTLSGQRVHDFKCQNEPVRSNDPKTGDAVRRCPNLWYGANAFDEGFHYDPVKLKNVLAREYDLIRAYWFDSYPEAENTKRGFFHFLETNGFRVDAKPLRKRDDGPVEKGADVGLASELIALGYEEAYDVAILVTGDDDFTRAVKYVQDRGKLVVVASFEATMSASLERMADEYVPLDDLTSKFERSYDC